MENELLEMLQYYLKEEPVDDHFILGSHQESFDAGKSSGKNELRREMKKAISSYKQKSLCPSNQ